MTVQQLPAVVTVSEAAKAPRCSVHTVRRAIQAGRLPAVRLAEHGPLRIPEAELRRFLLVIKTVVTLASFLVALVVGSVGVVVRFALGIIGPIVGAKVLVRVREITRGGA